MKRGLQALGRLKVGAMNKTEVAYAATLAERQHAGEVAWFKFEGMKFRLADNTFYTPDFAVMLVSGALEMHEVKGYWQDDAREDQDRRGSVPYALSCCQGEAEEGRRRLGNRVFLKQHFENGQQCNMLANVI